MSETTEQCKSAGARFIDDPIKQAKRIVFDNPTQYNIDELVWIVINEAKAAERARWITPIQNRVYVEIIATLSPRITDLIRSTGYGNSTVQKALKRLIEVGIVVKDENKIYYSRENGATNG